MRSVATAASNDYIGPALVPIVELLSDVGVTKL